MSLDGALRVHQERLVRATGQAAALLLGVDDPRRTLVAAMRVLAQSVGADRATVLRLRRSASASPGASPGTDAGGKGGPPAAVVPDSATLYFSVLYEWAASERLALGAFHQDLPVVGEGYDCTRWVALLDAGRALAITGPESLPADERAMLAAIPVRALLRAPIHHQGTLWGAVGFDRADNARPWLETEEHVLRALGDMLTALVLKGLFDTPAPGPGGLIA